MVTSAINTLVLAAKSNGWWTLCNAIYPFVGGTSTTCKFNLKDPRDLDAAFRLTFPNGATFANTGVDWNGTNQYANTFLTPSTTLSLDSTHMSYYSRENVAASADREMGVRAAGSDILRLLILFSGNATYRNVNDNGGGTIGVVTDTRGLFTIDRNSSSTTTNTYKNGSSIDTRSTASTTLATFPVLIGAQALDGSPEGNTSTKECAFATIGAGLGSTIAATMYNDIQTFQTTLGRQV
jgi:hypothetical protein